MISVIKKWSAVISLFILVFSPIPAMAATIPTLTIGALPPSVKVGELFTVPIVLNAQGQLIDTIRLRFVFEPDHLEAVRFVLGSTFPNVSPGGFIDNTSGVLYQGGFTINEPNGASSTFGQITFRAKIEGATTLTVDGASLLLYAGDRTNAGAGDSSSTLIVKGEPTIPTQEPQAVDSHGTPLFSVSLTHEANTVTALWEVQSPQSIDTFYFDFDQNPSTVAAKELPTAALPTGKLVFTNVDDGVWYFHLRGVLSDGSSVSAMEDILIDTHGPYPFAVYLDRTELTVGESVIVTFGTIDQTSGVENYRLQLDDQELGVQKSPYVLTVNKAGEQIVRVIAVDKAGNETEGHFKITVFPKSAFHQYRGYFGLLLAVIVLLVAYLYTLTRPKKHRHKSRK